MFQCIRLAGTTLMWRWALHCRRWGVEAKAEIARVQGTGESRQGLYKVVVRADGGAVREDDAEAELLDADGMLLVDGEVVAMAVNELPPVVWRTWRRAPVPARRPRAEDRVQLSKDGGAVATKIDYGYTRLRLLGSS
jgi:hypothetical protein